MFSSVVFLTMQKKICLKMVVLGLKKAQFNADFKNKFWFVINYSKKVIDQKHEKLGLGHFFIVKCCFHVINYF